ncbi:hypothetical protein [Oceanobacillus sp. AG]|uniref:hypothetical protein n=1 Tax=Oceanobacillus sp. AG TaxID=2681969 RepID=UPI0012EC465D|nr:hypothetical protein [Oceanobacillus sp. AG]
MSNYGVDTVFEWGDFVTAFWAFFVNLPLVTFIHQLGHYLMARLFGGRSEIVLGRGKQLFRIGAVKVNRFYFLDSFCHYESLKVNSKASHILVYAGGVLLNLFSLLLINILIMSNTLPETSFFYQFGYFTIYFMFYSLFPIQYSEKHASDGKQIINILRNKSASNIFD